MPVLPPIGPHGRMLANQIPPRLMGRIRHPRRSQVASPQTAGWLSRIPLVRLDLVSELPRDEPWRRYQTSMPQGLRLAMHRVAARPCLIGKGRRPHPARLLV